MRSAERTLRGLNSSCILYYTIPCAIIALATLRRFRSSHPARRKLRLRFVRLLLRKLPKYRQFLYYTIPCAIIALATLYYTMPCAIIALATLSRFRSSHPARRKLRLRFVRLLLRKLPKYRQYLYSLLYNTLCHHCFGYFEEAGNVCALYIVDVAILASSVLNAGFVDVVHNLVQHFVDFCTAPIDFA